jgi:hypothetical protein
MLTVEEVKDIIRKVQPARPKLNLSHDEAIRTAVYFALEDVLQSIDSRIDQTLCDMAVGDDGEPFDPRSLAKESYAETREAQIEECKEE